MSGDKQQTSRVTTEQLLKRTNNLYEAIVAISKEARRVNLISQTWGEEEKPVTKALINFAEGKVDYVLESNHDPSPADKQPGKKRGGKGK